MTGEADGADRRVKTESLVLGIDTCGPSGSVALGRLLADEVQILALRELAGRTYSATLVAAIAEVLARAGARLDELLALVAVHGPGSFTGVRVGLSAVKGLAEPAALPVAAVSRLDVLAAKAGVDAVALDAQRNELFLRVADGAGRVREILAAREDLVAFDRRPPALGLAEDNAARLAGEAWPDVPLVRVAAPTAADALHLGSARIRAHQFTDLVTLDGHYLRRPDAEILARLASSAGKA